MKMWKKLAIAVGLSALPLLVLTGCGEKKEKVVIYTSMENYCVEYMEDRLAEEFPQYNVVLEPKSSGEHAAALKASGTATDCDITHDLEYAYAAQIAELGYLADLSELVDYSVFVEDAVESQYYAPRARSGACVAVNTARLEALGLDMPTSYEDLLDPQYKGQISMPNPKSSGTGYMFLLSLVNAWGKEAALDYFDKLSENIQSFTSSGSGPATALASGEVAIGLAMTSDTAAQIRNGAPLEMIFFEEGAPYAMYGMGIIAGKEERTAVKEVFAFLSTTLNREICANFYPEKVYTEIDFALEGFPSAIKYADMNVADPGKFKEELLKEWKH